MGLGGLAAEENVAPLDLFLINGMVGVREMVGRELDIANPTCPGCIATTPPEEARNAVQQMKQVNE